MATYYRPNLTETERAWLITIVRNEVTRFQVMSDDFEAAYDVLLKLKKSKPISTEKKAPKEG